MPKKSINSANISYDSRKRSYKVELLSKKSSSLYAGDVRSLRLWTFFSTFAFLFQSDYAVVRLILSC
jgi:hypothetical protein